MDRIYVVTDTLSAATRLVSAPNPAQALRHVTSQRFAVKAASAGLVARLMSAGIRLEPVKPEPEPVTPEPADNATTEPQPATQPEGY